MLTNTALKFLIHDILQQTEGRKVFWEISQSTGFVSVSVIVVQKDQLASRPLVGLPECGLSGNMLGLQHLHLLSGRLLPPAMIRGVLNQVDQPRGQILLVLKAELPRY